MGLEASIINWEEGGKAQGHSVMEAALPDLLPWAPEMWPETSKMTLRMIPRAVQSEGTPRPLPRAAGGTTRLRPSSQGDTVAWALFPPLAQSLRKPTPPTPLTRSQI